MKGRYNSWRTFRQAIEKSLQYKISDKDWQLLKFVLVSAFIQPPCNKIDVKYAVKQFKELKKLT